MNRFKFGIVAEYVVSLIYMLCFYRILHYRYKTYLGEIDIIAVRGKTLVFIEVKARKRGISDEVISEKQLERIKNGAEIFISKNSKYSGYNMRFDFAFVQPYRWPLIIENAW